MRVWQEFKILIYLTKIIDFRGKKKKKKGVVKSTLVIFSRHFLAVYTHVWHFYKKLIIECHVTSEVRFMISKKSKSSKFGSWSIKKSKSIKSKCEKMNDWVTNCNMTMVHQIYPTLLSNKLLHFKIVENFQDVIAFTCDSARAYLGNFSCVFLVLNIIIPSGLWHLMGASSGRRRLMRWPKSRNRFNKKNSKINQMDWQ